MIDRQTLEALDREDPLGHFRARFQLPEGMIYLDGNSLGPVSDVARQRLLQTLEQEWQPDLIKSWNQHDWINLPIEIGNQIGAIIGAGPGQVAVTDSTSINLYKLINVALTLRPGRHTIVSNQDNFPTDLYMVQGLSAQLGSDRCQLNLVQTDEVVDAIDESTALVLLTQVDFRTGKKLDMAAITAASQDLGALILWDLSHSAGAFPVNLDDCNVDFAVGCGYKYLNGGPGAPGYLYIAGRHQDQVSQPLWGWMGHGRGFDFDPQYEPAPGVSQFLVGTPPILSLAALAGALSMFAEVDLDQIAEKSAALSNCFIQLMAEDPLLQAFQLRSPEDASLRGSQLSYAHEHGYAVMQALIERGVIGDFRAPDLLRFGFTPLYTRYVDIWDAVLSLKEIIASGEYKEERYNIRRSVT